MLYAVKLDPRATLPACAHPGEDLGYDLFALEDTALLPGKVTRVRTGIAAQAVVVHEAQGSGVYTRPLGLLIRDRSSMAAQGIFTHGGVVDAGYTGEIAVLMSTVGTTYTEIRAGAKIAQMVPVPVLTGPAVELTRLPSTHARGDNGFGSTGR